MTPMERRRGVSRRALPACLALSVVLTTGGCDVAAMQFGNDHRVTVLEPKMRSTVTTPLTIRWTYKDFELTGPDGSSDPRKGYFGVFVDRAPVPAGKTFAYVAHNDKSCRPQSGCPDAAYLADAHVYATERPEITLETLPFQPGVRDGLEYHTITVVLMDGSGRRIGESAWYVDVRFRRRG
jgi:hypothetical protein